jgi:hypothetical protein
MTCWIPASLSIGLVAKHYLAYVKGSSIRPLDGRLSAVVRNGRTKFCTGSYSVLAFQLLSSHWSQSFRVRFVTARLHNLEHRIQAGHTLM